MNSIDYSHAKIDWDEVEREVTTELKNMKQYWKSSMVEEAVRRIKRYESALCKIAENDAAYGRSFDIARKALSTKNEDKTEVHNPSEVKDG